MLVLQVSGNNKVKKEIKNKDIKMLKNLCVCVTGDN